MHIAGIVKNSFVDYPGRIAAVVFTRGCNLDCWYCHNRHLLETTEDSNEDAFLAFLNSRKGFLDGVVITGGEPLLQTDILDFMRKLKETGLSVKLDTNGTFPDVLQAAVDASLIDFIAMDVKAPYEKYGMITPNADVDAIRRSVGIIMQSGLDHEFRTTFVPGLDAEDIGKIAQTLKGAKSYCIQQYKKSDGMRASIAPEPHRPSEVRLAAELASQTIKNVTVRGV